MKLSISIGLLIFTFCSYSQEEIMNSKIEDSIKVHSPKKAIILSTFLPGSGQIYNHIAKQKGKKNAYWKLPLIYAGLGATGYFLIHNQQTQLSLKQEYTDRLEGNVLNPDWNLYDDQGVLTLYDTYLDRRDLSILGFGAIYLLQIVDAGIEAHFVTFDISEDLSLAIEPAYFGKNTLGLSFNLNFH